VPVQGAAHGPTLPPQGREWPLTPPLPYLLTATTVSGVLSWHQGGRITARALDGVTPLHWAYDPYPILNGKNALHLACIQKVCTSDENDHALTLSGGCIGQACPPCAGFDTNAPCSPYASMTPVRCL
jgi:hypothetical protein